MALIILLELKRISSAPESSALDCSALGTSNPGCPASDISDPGNSATGVRLDKFTHRTRVAPLESYRPGSVLVSHSNSCSGSNSYSDSDSASALLP